MCLCGVGWNEHDTPGKLDLTDRDEVEIATNGAANGVDGAHASGASTERESETRSTSGDVGGRQISPDVVDPITAASDAARG